MTIDRAIEILKFNEPTNEDTLEAYYMAIDALNKLKRFRIALKEFPLDKHTDSQYLTLLLMIKDCYE